MTQGQLAQRLGCTIHSVNAWENDRWRPAATRWPDIEAVQQLVHWPERLNVGPSGCRCGK